jgi:pyruvate/oxaloacetate carboxyltransferase
MKKSQTVLNLTHTDIETLEKKDFDGYAAIDVTEYCFRELDDDPWETLRFLRALFGEQKLRLTFCGQALLGFRHYPDEIVDAFVAAAVDNGINSFRIYDPLNDARNLETAAASVKKYGAELDIAIVYSEAPYSIAPYYAGLASQAAAMNADGVSVLCMTNELFCRELTETVIKASSLPVSVSAENDDIARIALDAGASLAETFATDQITAEVTAEIDLIRKDLGFPPLAYPVSEIVKIQAYRNVNSARRYETFNDDFKNLVLGRFGKLPASPLPQFINEICTDEPLILVRPADLLEPEYDRIREYIAPWLESEEDILTYAVYYGIAIDFFEKRKAKKYALDMPHAHKDKGIHII